MGISPWGRKEIYQSQSLTEKIETDDYPVFCQWWVRRRVKGMRASCSMFQELSSRFYSNRHRLYLYTAQHCKTHPALSRDTMASLVCHLRCLLSKGELPELSVRSIKETTKKKFWSGTWIPRDLTECGIRYLVDMGVVGTLTSHFKAMKVRSFLLINIV